MTNVCSSRNSHAERIESPRFILTYTVSRLSFPVHLRDWRALYLYLAGPWGGNGGVAFMQGTIWAWIPRT